MVSEKGGMEIEKNREYHDRYSRAVGNPMRREILRVLVQGEATIEELEPLVGLEREALEWHLQILERGYCVRKEIKQERAVYRITQEGRVVDYLQK